MDVPLTVKRRVLVHKKKKNSTNISEWYQSTIEWTCDKRDVSNPHSISCVLRLEDKSDCCRLWYLPDMSWVGSDQVEQENHWLIFNNEYYKIVSFPDGLGNQLPVIETDALPFML